MASSKGSALQYFAGHTVCVFSSTEGEGDTEWSGGWQQSKACRSHHIGYKTML